MYKIIGADGQQYGPVTAEQLREWITINRANGQTLAQVEGATEWKPLAAFPEFTAVLGVQPPPPLTGPPPVLTPPDARALGDEVIARDYAVDIGGCIGRGWEKVKSDFWPIVGVSALISILMSASHSLYFAGVIVAGPLMGGLFWYYLKHLRGQQPTIGDAFGGFALAFLQLLLAALVSALLTSLGLALCVIPGIYLGVAWCLTLPLVIDKKLQFWDAMELSRRVVSRHWWSFLGLLLVSVLLNLAGVLLCCVGAFVTAPVTGFALMYAYEDVFKSVGPDQT